MASKGWLKTLISLAVVLAGPWMVKKTAGVATLFLTGVVLACVLILVRIALQSASVRLGRPRSFLFLARLNLLVVSSVLALIGFEAFLRARAAWVDHHARSESNPTGSAPLTMPEEWKRRETKVEGATHASWWHNKLHVYNADGMRTTRPFSEKDPGTFRIMVLGDSLTYGEGVEEGDTYSRVLERELSKQFRVEVLNLGVCGAQSEDVKQILFRHFDSLQPDLVLYGVCLNDFLPSGVGQYDNNRSWSVRFPMQEHFEKKTLVGEFLAKKYDDLLRTWGVRVDFYTDILRDFHGCRTRFRKDVKEMNDYVVGRGRPPVVAMCLHQSLTQPLLDQVGLPIIRFAEEYLAEAGMQVVSSAEYVQKYAGRCLRVSPWEGHPNEECHHAFAEEFLKAIQPLPCLKRYAREEIARGPEGYGNRSRP
jgi:hypothetical protein